MVRGSASEADARIILPAAARTDHRIRHAATDIERLEIAPHHEGVSRRTQHVVVKLDDLAILAVIKPSFFQIIAAAPVNFPLAGALPSVDLSNTALERKLRPVGNARQ